MSSGHETACGTQELTAAGFPVQNQAGQHSSMDGGGAQDYCWLQGSSVGQPLGTAHAPVGRALEQHSLDSMNNKRREDERAGTGREKGGWVYMNKYIYEIVKEEEDREEMVLVLL